MRHASRLCRFALAAIVACLASTAQAQRLDAETLRAYGGTYSANCARPDAPRLIATADRIAVQRGNQRMDGLKPQAQGSFFGRSPPRNYLTTLVGEVRGRHQMIFIIHQDRQGKYAKVDGDRDVVRALGSLTGQLYRRCGEAGAAQARPAPSPPAQTPPAQTPSARAAQPTATDIDGLLRDPRFRTPYHKALGAKTRERWLARLDGPAPEPRNVRVAGSDYLLIAACKQRDCGDNSTVLLYSAAQGVVYGQIHERGRNTLIGAPPPAVAAELDRLWRAEWRQ